LKTIVLDTNCLLQILPKRSPYRWLLDMIRSGKVRLALSNEILAEYAEILEQQLNASIAHNVVQALLDSPYVHMVSPTYRWQLISQDADDDKFVDCFIAAGADFLISNDGHFDELENIPFPKVQRIRLDEADASRFN